jgi:thymidylate kinase
MKKGIFICFTGIDGSGKTTLANITIDTLNKYDLESNYAYCGWRQFESPIIKPIVHLLTEFISNQTGDNPIDKTRKESMDEKVKDKFSYLFEFMLLIDYIFIIFIKLILPLCKGNNIVCDRYFYDVAINTGLDLSKSTNEIRKLLNLLRFILPKPNIVFLVDVPIGISYSRKDDIPYDGYLSKHRKLFLDIANDSNMVILNGTLPLDKQGKIIELNINRLLR